MGMRRRNGRPPVRRLSVGLFGGVRFASDTEPWRFSAPPRTLPLLAYLILHRSKAVARESAAFALWPDDDESSARANFRRHLLYLRNALPEPPPGRPWILSDGRTTVQWNPDAACWIDAVEFERLSADDSSLAAAVELYAGDLLEELSDDWIIAERERLRDLQVSNLSKLIVAARRDGEIAESLQFAQQLFALDPWREDALRHVMELRYALGDRAGALAEYERFASRLETELNASPMAESQACYESLVRNAPVLHEARASATPGDVAARHALLPFVGRERELERLQVWWTRAARGGGNVGLIGGEAGIGKSRLLAELKRIAESQGGRVLLGAAGSSGDLAYRPIVEALTSAVPMLETVSIEPIWLAVAANLLPSLARGRFDVARAPAIESGQERVRLFEAVFQVLRALAEQRPVLLVLEDLHWSGQATIDLVDYLDDRIGATRILIVGSYRDEEVLRAHPLRRLRRKLDRGRQAARLMLGPIAKDAVVALVAKLRKRMPELGDAGELLHARSEGNPLFITQLIASSSESLAPGRLAERAPGLRAVIAERLERLSIDTRSLAMMASVIGNAFDVELLRELTGWSEERVGGGLSELLDRHLVHDTGLGGSGDYAFSHHLIESAIYGEASQHDLKRRHERIARALQELYPDRLEELSIRIAQQYERSTRVDRAAPFYAMAARNALGVFAYEDAIVRATRGLELAAGDRDELALLLAREAALARVGNVELRERDLAALARLAPADPVVRCDVQRRTVEFFHATDRRPEEESAIAAFEALAERSRLEEPLQQAAYLRARFLMVSSRCREALVECATALERARTIDDVVAQTRCLCLMADIRDRCADFVGAERDLAEARALGDGSGDPAVQLAVLFASCRLANWQNRYDEVRTLAARMREIAEASGDRNRAASALNALGVAALYEFEVADARRCFAAAAELSATLGRPRNVIAARLNQVLLDTRLGRLDDAIASAREVKAMAAAAGAHLFEESVTSILAEALLRNGNAAAAQEAALDALKATQGSNSKNRVPAIFAVARCEAAQDDLRSAIAHMLEGLDLLDEANLRIYAADATATLAQFHLRAGMLREALAATRSFVAVLESCPARFEEPDALHWIAAKVYLAQGDTTKFRAHADRAWSIYQARLEKIPDVQSREAYAALSFHREIVEDRLGARAASRR